MSSSQASPMRECCMCGDRGLTYELFQCTACQFRSQHRYCSSLYPKAESYEVCNWCLRTLEEESKERSHDSSHSSSSNKTNSEEDSKEGKLRKKRGIADADSMKSPSSSGGHQIHVKVKIDSRDVTGKKDEKVKISATDGSPAVRGRAITRGRFEEMKKDSIHEKKSGKGANDKEGAVHKYSFRHRVRRYKLLDEVSS